MGKQGLNTLNPIKFTELIKNRETAIASAPSQKPTAENDANKLAKAMHPHKQYMTVTDVIEHNGAKTFRLEPDKERGTEGCAYFSAGQYITVYSEIGGKIYSRPYSIVSSPKDALDGYYLLTVKAVEGGLISNFILDNWSNGSRVTVSAPIGNFTYEPLRDAKQIIGIAGGSGITPFVSLAKAIANDDEDCTLTLLYGNRREQDILFRDELNTLVHKCERIKVVHILSDEEMQGYENGYITAELISKYAPPKPYSVFICGPRKMTAFVDKEIQKLGLERKFIRHEVHGEIADPTELPDYEGNFGEVNITVNLRGEKRTVTGNSQNTVLRILEDNGITPPTRCRSGECGFCHSRLVSGNIYIPKEFDKRRQADDRYGYIHPCCSYPLSDLEIEISEN